LSAAVGVAVGVTATTALSCSRPSADVRSKRRAKIIRPSEIAYKKSEKPQKQNVKTTLISFSPIAVIGGCGMDEYVYFYFLFFLFNDINADWAFYT